MDRITELEIKVKELEIEILKLRGRDGNLAQPIQPFGPQVPGYYEWPNFHTLPYIQAMIS